MFKASVVAIGLALGVAVPASAQVSNSCTGGASCSVNLTASVTIPVLISLDMATAVAGQIALTSPSAADLTTGYVDDVGPTITVKANRSWTLAVKTTNAVNWTYAGGNGGVKPISDLEWSADGGATFAAITTSNATLATGTKTNGDNPTLNFRTLYPDDFSDNRSSAGTYSIDLVFTLTAP